MRAIEIIKAMRYIFVIVPFVAMIAYHVAWNSIECPLLLSIAALICVTIKVKSDEQRKKKTTKGGGDASE